MSATLSCSNQLSIRSFDQIPALLLQPAKNFSLFTIIPPILDQITEYCTYEDVLAIEQTARQIHKFQKFWMAALMHENFFLYATRYDRINMKTLTVTYIVKVSPLSALVYDSRSDRDRSLDWASEGLPSKEFKYKSKFSASDTPPQRKCYGVIKNPYKDDLFLPKNFKGKKFDTSELREYVLKTNQFFLNHFFLNLGPRCTQNDTPQSLQLLAQKLHKRELGLFTRESSTFSLSQHNIKTLRNLFLQMQNYNLPKDPVLGFPVDPASELAKKMLRLSDVPNRLIRAQYLNHTELFTLLQNYRDCYYKIYLDSTFNSQNFTSHQYQTQANRQYNIYLLSQEIFNNKPDRLKLLMTVLQVDNTLPYTAFSLGAISEDLPSKYINSSTATALEGRDLMTYAFNLEAADQPDVYVRGVTNNSTVYRVLSEHIEKKNQEMVDQFFLEEEEFKVEAESPTRDLNTHNNIALPSHPLQLNDSVTKKRKRKPEEM